MIPARILTLSEQLAPQLPDEFARLVLEGSIRVAWDNGNPIRVNLFAAGLRELVTYVLHEAAPDEQVRRCIWFKEDANLKAKRETEGKDLEPRVTRRQRMTYATQGGLSDKLLVGLGVDISAAHRELAGVFDRLNKLTHVRPGTRITADADVVDFMDEALKAVLAFYETLASCRSEVGDAVAEGANDSALASLTETVVQELDELSTHTFVEEVEVEEVSVTAITADSVSFEASGTVHVTLNYGSGSDFRRGDGASMPDSYPFSLSLEAPTRDIHRLKAGRPRVDNSSFYE